MSSNGSRMVLALAASTAFRVSAHPGPRAELLPATPDRPRDRAGRVDALRSDRPRR